MCTRLYGVLLISLHTYLNIGLDDFSKFAVYEIGNVFGAAFPCGLHWYVLITVKIDTSVRSTKQLPGGKRRGKGRGEGGKREGRRRGRRRREEGGRRRREEKGGKEKGEEGERMRRRKEGGRRRKMLSCAVIETSYQKSLPLQSLILC